MPQPGAGAENYTIFEHSLHSTQQASTCLSEAMPSHSTHYPGAPLFLLYSYIGHFTQGLSFQGRHKSDVMKDNNVNDLK